MSRSTAATLRPQTNNAVRGWLQRNARSFQPPASSGRRRPALPSGYEPPDYLVVPVRLADGRVLHVNADDLADPRYVNVRNLNPDGTPVKGRAGLQARAVFEGAEVLAQPWYGTEYRAESWPPAQPDHEAASAVNRLFQQAVRAGIRLMPEVEERLALGDPHAVAYVADLVSQLGGRPAVEPRYEGGPIEPGRTYTVNEHGPESVLDRSGQARPIANGQPALVQARQPGTVVPHESASAQWSTDNSAPARKPSAPRPATHSAAATAEPSTILEKITSAASTVGNVVKDTAVGLGKTARAALTVSSEPLNPYAWAEGLPLTRAAGNAALTGLTSMGASTNHFLGRFTPAGRNLRGHLEFMRGELDKGSAGSDFASWLKKQDQTLQPHLSAWYAGVRPLDDGRPTTEDITLAGQRGLTNAENRLLFHQYQQTRDPEVWAKIERNIMITPEEMAVKQMREDVMRSEGGQKYSSYYGKGASEDLLNTYHPVNLATTVVPLAKGYTAAQAVAKAAQGSLWRTAAGNVVRSLPAGAGYGALQQIEADPQISAADLGKGVLKNMAITGGMTAAGAVLGAAARKHVPDGFRNLPAPGPKGETLYTYTYEPWKGPIMKAKDNAARQWASVHPPGKWAYKTDPYHTALRVIRTGHVDPFVDWRSIQGAARQHFIPAQGIGPLRLWKRTAGQHYTERPGPLNLETGIFSDATPAQKSANARSTQMAKYADPAAWAVGALGGEAVREIADDAGPAPLAQAIVGVQNLGRMIGDKFSPPRKK